MILLVAALNASLMSCSSDDDENNDDNSLIVGTWVQEEDYGTFEMVLRKNGTGEFFIIYSSKRESDGEFNYFYNEKKGTLTIEYNEEEDEDIEVYNVISLTSKRLVLEDEYGQEVYTKKK